MKLTVFLASLTFSVLASADMMAPATLDLKCVPTKAGQGKSFLISSNRSGSAVVINGKAYPDAQLIAGTEGGPVDLQAVNNQGGFNITLAGGDLVKAFDARSRIQNATVKASVQLFPSNKNFEAICKGLISFID